MVMVQITPFAVVRNLSVKKVSYSNKTVHNNCHGEMTECLRQL